VTGVGRGQGPAGSIDWKARVRERAFEGGCELSPGIIDELAEHLEDLYRGSMEAGAGPEEALASSLEALTPSSLHLLSRPSSRNRRGPGAGTAEDDARAARGRSIDVIVSLRAALRQFRKHRSFALLTVLVMGLGVSAATTIYTILDSVVLRPLPYRDADRLVTIWDTNLAEGHVHDPISPVNFSDQRELAVFEDAAAWWRPGVNLVDPGLGPVRVSTIEVSGNLFELLGVRPRVGSGFPDGGPLFVQNELIAVISDRLWRNRYGSDPSLVGKEIRLNDTPYTVVGIMPERFHFPDDVDVWERLRWDMTQHSRQARFMEAVARLSPGTSIDQAQSAIDSLWTRLETETAASRDRTGAGWGSRLVPLLDEQLGYYRPALYVLVGAVGLLLVIGVLNVSSLLLTRALSREREVALRIAMGASPGQLLAQLVAESFLLSFGAALVGLVSASIALPLVVHLAPVPIPRLAEAGIGWGALGVGFGIAGGTTLIFGLVPALLLLRRQVTTDLKSGERGSSRGARRGYSLLVALEVALACALLTSSALLVRTVHRMVMTPIGVDADPVLTTSVQLASDAYSDWSVVASTHSRILERIREQPGVQAAGATNFLPFGVGWRTPFAIRGAETSARVEDLPQAQMHAISDGYVETMGATLVEGRAFTPFDRPDAPGVVMVNESFANEYLKGRPPVGCTLTMYSQGVGPLGRNLLGTHPPYALEVVGVLRDIRNAPLGQPTEPAYYVPTRQFPFRDELVVVRATDPATALEAVRATLRELAPDVPLAGVRTWGERLAERTAEPRLLMNLLLLFGVVAALLASLGVYGLLSWSVLLRRRELAIRLTLGARPSRVGGLVVRQSASLVATGLILGLLILRLSERALALVLFEVSPGDAGSTAAAAGILIVAALLACAPPAIRAMRVDPVEGLRTE
jgi:putative ABC transport system permease protein